MIPLALMFLFATAMRGAGSPVVRLAGSDDRDVEAPSSDWSPSGAIAKGDWLLGARERPTVTLPSPWGDVPDKRWTGFVHRLATQPHTRSITPQGNLGLWEIGYRRLVDIGLADGRTLRRVELQGRPVWVAHLRHPLTAVRFVSSPESSALQYAALLRSLRDYRSFLDEEFPRSVGKVVDGRPVTLSGLLSVAHRASYDGVASWLEGRKRYPSTIALFGRCNRLF